MNLFVGGFSQQKDSLLVMANQLRDQAHELSVTDQCEEAITTYGQAISLFEQIEAWDSVAYSRMDQAMCLHYLERFRQMDAYLYKADSVARAYLSPTDKIWVHLFHLEGASAYLIGDMEGAENSTQQFLTYLQRTQAPEPELLFAYSNLAQIFSAKGEFDKAIEYYQATLGIIDTTNKKGLERRQVVYSGLSEAFRRSHQESEAIRYALYELKDAQRLSGKRGESAMLMAYNDLGASYIARELYDSALYYLEKAKTLHQKNAIWQASTDHNLAYAYRELNQVRKAEFHLKRGIELNTEKHGPYFANIAKDYRHLGQVSIRQDKWESALDYYQKALATLAPGFVSTDWGDNPSPDSVSAQLNLLRTLRDKTEALHIAYERTEDRQHLNHAFETVQLAIQVIFTLRLSYQEGSEQILNEDYLPVFELGMVLADRLYRLEGDMVYLEAGFQFSENSKATLLMEHLKDAEARQQAGIPEASYQQQLQLKRNLAYYEQEIFQEKTKGADSDTTKLFTWRQKVFSLKRSYESLMAELEATYPYYTQLKYQQQQTSLADIQAQLTDPQMGVLVYSVGKDNVFIFSITQDEIQWHRTPYSDSLMEQVSSLRAWVQHLDWASERSRDPLYLASFVEHATSISQQLIHPVLTPDMRMLTIIPDGALGYLPFELLFSTSDIPADSMRDFSHLPYLLKQCAIRYEYRAALLATDVVSDHPNHKLLGFAPAYPSTFSTPSSRSRSSTDHQPFAPLLHNQSEVEAIHELVDGNVLLGNEATESAFRELAGQFGILHLAMHAFTNDLNPLYSGLAFAPTASAQTDSDGILYAYELYNLNLQANLVVMSACNTGAGTLAKGEGIISLARAFRYGGASNIAMSLWQADDQATSEILQQFYENLIAGYGNAEALRRAKLTYLKQSKMNPPFYWSTMVLIGADDSPYSQSSSPLLWLLGGMIIALLGILLFIRQRSNA
ncbi:MAG: CHAT domain-containing protein [Bacteroidota bacterium]